MKDKLFCFCSAELGGGAVGYIGAAINEVLTEC